ncbi:hypothetical protein COW99_04330 [Candidatus Roizmanbacteria bacterium CG22_combo_CG10-13_8_21_14_all_38_20]|uniref:Methyltransferase small domain-containing protein n=1 Tax=Candidatus Roizmanbacteria bacterium CG22_combo_CG10-13_8_21_14_all_38_20 TaxID=1974862 RepID=A0A2H0BUP2_9BACT|nr:MAG: hypothetical protein COW99_04330 [Candidatus Roizmanbacteria bacterium CG22_combo_CG10-13_8_21_14_all_38_20]PJC30522.1 MAG: hypothetical protein CO050_06070 [Candidatus Roizmanbacteria bacterium CG_4_9_14_0_2_um_filter_38_17]
MIAENISLDLRPAQKLLSLHSQHKTPYEQEFMGLQLVIYPNVFNPAFTKVTRMLAENLNTENSSVVLDMFCGSGVLGLLVKQQASKVVGVDASSEAIACAHENATRNLATSKTDFRVGNLWQGVLKNEKFDLIIANPPLLPATPETILEMAVADSPDMSLATQFIQGCHSRLNDSGRVLMTFSNASKVSFVDPLGHIEKLVEQSGLSLNIVAEKDYGYEIYRVLEFRKS